MPVEAVPTRELERNAGLPELHVGADHVRGQRGHRRARHEVPDVRMVVGRAQHLAQAATSTGQGLELEIGRAVGLLALLLQPPECVQEAGEPGSVDGALHQQVSVREEELALRLAQKPRPVT